MYSILIKNIKEIVTMDQERNRLKGYSLLIEKEGHMLMLNNSVTFSTFL
jgi:hypothetical protein